MLGQRSAVSRLGLTVLGLVAFACGTRSALDTLPENELVSGQGGAASSVALVFSGTLLVTVAPSGGLNGGAELNATAAPTLGASTSASASVSAAPQSATGSISTVAIAIALALMAVVSAMDL